MRIVVLMPSWDINGKLHQEAPNRKGKHETNLDHLDRCSRRPDV